MEKFETAGADARPANRSVCSSPHRWPAGRKILFGAAIVGVLAGIVLNWNWLVAAGIAPLILAAVPCLAMCAFGLCADKLRGDQSCAPAKADSSGNPGVSPERPTP